MSKQRFMIKKITSILLVVLSTLCLFRGWININDDEIGNLVEEFRAEMGYLGSYELKEAQEEVDDFLDDNDINLDISVKKIYNIIEKTIYMFEDEKISPYEMAGVANGLGYIYNISSKIIDTVGLWEVFYSDEIDTLHEMRTICYSFFAFFLITVIIGVLTIIFMIVNKKGMEYVLTAVDLILIINTIYRMNSINKKLYMTVYSNVLNMTAIPFLSLICCIIAVILWYMANKEYKTAMANGGFVSDEPVKFKPSSFLGLATGADANVGGKIQCAGCGNFLKADAMFCPMCGMKKEDVQPKKKLFCVNCGCQLNEDEVFCHQCGVATKK